LDVQCWFHFEDDVDVVCIAFLVENKSFEGIADLFVFHLEEINDFLVGEDFFFGISRPVKDDIVRFRLNGILCRIDTL
jgi:hypothetical protein